MNPIDTSAATASIIATWGAPGAIIVILLAVCGVLAFWLYNAYQGRLNDANKRTDEVRADLASKYKDAEETRDVIRELKGSIDMNTKTIETALSMMKSRGL